VDFPSNSIGSEPVKPPKEEPEEKKVISGEVIRRKTPLGKRFLHSFIGGQAREVFDYVVFDILVPAAKDMVVDSVSSGIERMLKGDSVSNRRTVMRGDGRPYVSYNRYSSSTPTTSRPPFAKEEPNRRRGRPGGFRFDEIILATRAEAEMVKDRMFDIIQRYDVVKVSDLYEMIGLEGTHVDERWGWTDLRGMGISWISNGYLLELPPPEPLN